VDANLDEVGVPADRLALYRDVTTPVEDTGKEWAVNGEVPGGHFSMALALGSGEVLRIVPSSVLPDMCSTIGEAYNALRSVRCARQPTWKPPLRSPLRF
jgi:hypothetical protein